MTVSNADYLLGVYNAQRVMGDKSISSDSFFAIEGWPQIGLLIKQFPWPTLSPGDGIDMPGPMGMAMWQPSQLKVQQEGQMTFTETVRGSVQSFLEEVIRKNKGIFQATVYEGTPVQFHRAQKLRDCFFVSDIGDRDWEARTVVTTISGSLKYHYFGETIPGNIVPI